MDDPRLTPARGDIAAKHLEGKVEAARFVDGETFEVIETLAPMRDRPTGDAMLLTQALAGERAQQIGREDEGACQNRDRDLGAQRPFRNLTRNRLHPPRDPGWRE